MTVPNMPLAWAPARRGRDGKQRKHAVFTVPTTTANQVIGLAVQFNLAISGALELMIAGVEVDRRGRILGTKSWGEERNEAPAGLARELLAEEGQAIRETPEDGDTQVSYYIEVTTVEKIHRVASYYGIKKYEALARLIDSITLNEEGHSIGTLGSAIPAEYETREEELPLTSIS